MTTPNEKKSNKVIDDSPLEITPNKEELLDALMLFHPRYKVEKDIIAAVEAFNKRIAAEQPEEDTQP